MTRPTEQQTEARILLLDRLERYFDTSDRRTIRTWLALLLSRLPDLEVAALAIRLDQRQNKRIKKSG